MFLREYEAAGLPASLRMKLQTLWGQGLASYSPLSCQPSSAMSAMGEELSEYSQNK